MTVGVTWAQVLSRRRDRHLLGAIPAYPGAHGPASADAFSQWLCRSAANRSAL
ncbi:MAG: hypothetical protein QOJ30_5288 [Pseudonocardiales bacterium]|jgi:hypothetical protein|nr:hypothetical protein [Pseudonocardiales bacterium]